MILRLEVSAAQKLHDCIADLDLVATAKLTVLHELIVDVCPVRRMQVEDVIALTPNLDAGVSARDAVTVKDDVVVVSTTDSHGAAGQRETLAQLVRARRIDHHETILARSGPDVGFRKGSNPRLDFALHGYPPRLERLVSGVNVAG
jgi:hypothetical protein